MNTETASVSSSGTALRVQAPNNWSDSAMHLALCSIVLLAGCGSNMHAGYDGLSLDAAYRSSNSTKVISLPQTISTPHLKYKDYDSPYVIVMATSDVLSALELLSKRNSKVRGHGLVGIR